MLAPPRSGWRSFWLCGGMPFRCVAVAILVFGESCRWLPRAFSEGGKKPIAWLRVSFSNYCARVLLRMMPCAPLLRRGTACAVCCFAPQRLPRILVEAAEKGTARAKIVNLFLADLQLSVCHLIWMLALRSALNARCVMRFSPASANGALIASSSIALPLARRKLD